MAVVVGVPEAGACAKPWAVFVWVEMPPLGVSVVMFSRLARDLGGALSQERERVDGGALRH